ncbi:MurR/RpiR family transcriptional regulator [Clostridium vincentii]|uniref:Putative HTH-type transcriptional regulator YbbH n=1 Tax=Clostridium vincentii TaxID=52704 RepID=A0A2T0BIW3_9CLOT|nr:MurR/RpiR family transcriptional regulator [Clostridium vincentii]PRR83783.1 putative HTH-type transcriptional regulator YbbH [Clostridium vincentii]
MIIEELKNTTNLTNQEKLIASYILENPDNVKSISSRKLAKLAYTSQSTVIRLCRKLGFDSYREFQIEYNLAYKSSLLHYKISNETPINMKTRYEEIIHLLPKIHMDTVAKLQSTLNQNTMIRIANYLAKADYIDLYGLGLSNIIARQAAFKFMSIGFNCTVHDGINTHYILAASNHKRVALFMTFTGENATVLDICKKLKKRNVYTVIICEDNSEILKAYCDEIICIDSGISYLNLESYSSIISAHFAFDILFSLMLTSNYDKSLEASMNILKEKNKT